MSRPFTDIEPLCSSLVGEPARIKILKDKPGRRRTSLATGPAGAVVVKAYASQRAPVVARRLRALAAGPEEPEVPRVLLCDESRRLVALTHVPGEPLTRALTDGRLDVVEAAGAAIGSWHAHWYGRVPPELAAHPVEKELAILDERAGAAPPAIAGRVKELMGELGRPWAGSTVVHRDLYEAQVVVGAHVGLIDLDDAACGPPELDVGNLLAHLTLLGLHLDRSVARERDAFLRGYRSSGPDLETERLEQCEILSRLRLACIWGEPALLSSLEYP